MTDRPGTDTLSYDDGPAVLLVTAPDAPDRLPAAVAAMRGRSVRHDWQAALPAVATPDLIAIEAGGTALPVIAAALPRIAAWARDQGVPLVVALAGDQIDVVAAVTLGGATTLLVDPDTSACAGALAIAARRRDDAAHFSDVARESDASRYERLNAEVARIAETLVRLTQAEAARDSAAAPFVGDRSVGYGTPPAAVQPTATEIRSVIRARRLRDQFFGPGHCEDPGWDMLLDLFAAELEGVRVSVSSLCIAAAVAPTTALRWIARLTDAGLFERYPDPHDRRRAFMALSTRASGAMRDYMAAVRRADLAIP